MTTIYLYVLLGVELLFLLGFLVFIVYLLRQRAAGRRQRAAETAELMPDARSIRAYIKGQVLQTRQDGFPVANENVPKARLSLLRCHYLGAEYEALGHPIGSDPYWQSLERYLSRLLGILTEGKLGDGTASRRKAGLQRVKSGTQAVNRNVSRLSDAVQRQHHSVKALSEELEGKTRSGAVKVSEAQNRQLQSNIAASSEYVTQLERSVSVMRNALKAAEDRIKQYQEREQSSSSLSRAGDSALIITQPSHEESSDDLDTLLSQTNEMNRLNKEEIYRLHETIAQQRKVIFQLESLIKNLEDNLSGVSGSELQLQELDKLKRVLRETEDCVHVLESEVELLQNKLDEPVWSDDAEQVASNDSDETVSQLAALQEEVENKETQLRRSQQVMSGIQKMLEAQSLEDLALVLVAALKTIGIGCYLHLKGDNGKVSASSSGRFPDDIKRLLNASSFQGSEEIRDTAHGRLCVCKGVTALLDGLDSKMDGSVVIDQAIEVVRLASPLVVKVSALQGSQSKYSKLRYTFAAIQKLLSSVDAQYSYQTMEGESIIKTLSAQYSQLVQLMGPTANQQKEFENIQREISERVALMGQNRKMTKTYFAKLLQRLNEEP